MKLLNASLMCTGENGFTSEMRKIGTEGYWELNPGTPNFNTELIKLVDAYSPDLIYLQIQNPGIITEAAASYIGSKCIVFNHSGDIRAHLDQWYYDIGRFITCTLFTNNLDVSRLRDAGIESRWMEIGVDPTRYKDWGKMHKSPKIIFSGNNYGPGYFPLSQYRIEAVNRLKKEFGDDFGVMGTGWPDAIGEFNGDQVRESQQYSSALIALNISHFAVSRYSSDRLLRALASKCMVISHSYPNIQYIPGEHLAIFDHLDELVEKCHYYLDNKQERMKIADAGQKHALENYTFRHMAENIKNLYLNYSK